MIRKILGIFSLAALLAMGFAGRAKADGIDNFTFTSGGNTFVWQLPDAPVPDGEVNPGNGFVLNNVAISMNGGAPILSSIGMGFYAAFLSGGFDFQVGETYVGTGFCNRTGPQLYTGPESNPKFSIGTFQLTDFGTAADCAVPDVGVPGTLTISSAPVPEPSTYLLMIVGSLGLLLAARRKG